MSKLIKGLTVFLLISLTAGCTSNEAKPVLKFAVAAEYPPFEYQEYGTLKGFDIELAQLIANELGKKAEFQNMQFSTILPAISSNQADAGISTITITEARKVNFDFSDPYLYDSIALVFNEKNPIHNKNEMVNKKIAAQLGSTMEVWLKKNLDAPHITILDNNNQAIESLKSGRIDGVLMDGAQGESFTQKNKGLNYAIIAESEEGYGIVLKKHSPLTNDINQALKSLQKKGEIEKLKQKWLTSKKEAHS